MRTQRSIAQPGRALRSGRRGRGFEPRYSDQIKFPDQCGWGFFLLQYIRVRTHEKVGRTAAKRWAREHRFALAKFCKVTER